MKTSTIVLSSLVVTLAGTVLTLASAQQSPPDSERQVKEAEVAPAALAALKKQANGAAISEFAEEIEHGHKFYEGTWKGPHGQVDCLVTETGDVVEIEESIDADSASTAVREAARAAAGANAEIKFERKTKVLYEIHYSKDGHGHEMIFTPDGRVFHEEGGDEPAGDDEREKGN